MKIALNSFTGETPKTLPHLLSENAAQSAVDCDFSANVLIGMKAMKPEFLAPTGTQDLFAYGTSLESTFAFTKPSCVVRGPIPDDKFDRYYWTDGDTLRVSSAQWRAKAGTDAAPVTRSYRAGVAAPTKAPKVTSTSTFEIDGVSLSDWVAKAYCEDTSGVLSKMTSVVGGKLKVGSVSAKDVKASAQISLACNVTATTLPAGFSDAGEFLVEALVDKSERARFVFGGYLSINKTKAAASYIKSDKFFGRKYRKVGSDGKFVTYYYLFNYKAWEALGKPAVESGEFDPGFQLTDEAKAKVGGGQFEGDALYDATDYSAKLQYLGAGWFAQAWHGTMTKPTFTPNGLDITGVKTSDYSEPILVLSHNGKKITLRSDSNKSSFPSGMKGLHGSIEFTAGKVTVYIWKDASVSYVTERAYVYTYVNIFDEEGPPSPPTSFSVSEGMSVSVLPYLPVSSAWADFVPIKAVRIYRTETGSSGTDYFFTKELTVATANIAWTDNLLATQLGETMQTLYYAPPPTKVHGLVMMPNGILAYFSGNKVYFSEPYLPYACNASNASQMLHDVVSLMPTDNGLYVTTKSYPYLIAGVSPETMVASRIPAIQAGVSLKSICDIGPYAVYASHDGLVALSGMSASLELSQRFFTREAWRDRYGSRLSKMRMNAYDGHLVVWFTDGSPGFLMRFDDAAPYLVKMSHGATAAYVNPLNDALYFVYGNATPKAVHVGQFRAGSSGGCVWHSKDFVTPKPVNFGAYQLVGKGEVTVYVYADGALSTVETTLINNTGRIIKRMPSGFKARRWSFKIQLETGAQVDEFNVAESPVEFADV